VVVGHGIQVLVSNFNVSCSFLGKNGVTLDDEGVAQFVAGIMPQARRGVAEQTAIRVVINRIGDTQVVVHQRRHEVEVGSPMSKL